MIPSYFPANSRLSTPSGAMPDRSGTIAEWNIDLLGCNVLCTRDLFFESEIRIGPRRNPDAPPVIGCSLGGSGQLQHADRPPRGRKTELAEGQLLGGGDGSGGKEAVTPPAGIVIGPHSESDSDSESDVTEAGPESEADGDTDSVVFTVRDNGGSEGSDDGFGGDALIELLGNVDDVIDALEGPRGGKKKGRNGRRARRMAKKKHMEQQLQLGKRMSMRLVTALGLGFEGRAQAVPVVMANGAFPDFGNADTVRHIFGLPKERPPHFLLLCRRNASPGLEKSLDRLGNLLPGGTRLAAVSAGERPSVVSSFPATGKACVGVCLIGDISVQEQAELASKTFGAFSVSDVRVLGGACEELFVPHNPSPLPSPPSESGSEPELQPGSASRPEVTDPPSPKTSSGKKTARVERKTGPSQLCVFKIDDFVYPGMRRRYHIFEPRYRALVKQCLRDGQALLLLPLSGDGNNVGTAAYVSGLYNVHEDGRCDIEITGLARCQVKTIWMRGESFGLHEAVVEYFEDEDAAEAASEVADPEGSDVALLSGQESGGGGGGESESEGGHWEEVAEVSGERSNPRSYSELQQLRVLVSAVLHRELFRTRRTGFSPMWPTWQGNSSDIAADLLSRASDADDDSQGFSSGLADLDAESLSFWAAQHVAADPETKLRWLTCTSTETRLRDITARLTDQAALMARRSGGGGGGGSGGNDNLYKLLRDIYATKGGGRGGGHGRDR